MDIEKIKTVLLRTSQLREINISKDGNDSNSFNFHRDQEVCNTNLNIESDGIMICNCNTVKVLLTIKISGNLEDLAVTCHGVKAANSIADLVDGYCRIVNRTDASFWERISSPPYLGTVSPEMLDKQTENEKKSFVQQLDENSSKVFESSSELCKFFFF